MGGKTLSIECSARIWSGLAGNHRRGGQMAMCNAERLGHTSDCCFGFNVLFQLYCKTFGRFELRYVALIWALPTPQMIFTVRLNHEMSRPVSICNQADCHFKFQNRSWS